MTRCKGDQVGEALHGHGGAVLDVARYRVMQAEKFGHGLASLNAIVRNVNTGL
ncbi:hypothetical protein [Modicisalibacter luteus]|uniref:hypothetical protein n=1 Tax=Modicisalibacter luteus TaxID=453962 RepID=UPI0036423398